jgi:hypothetical protein
MECPESTLTSISSDRAGLVPSSASDRDRDLPRAPALADRTPQATTVKTLVPRAADISPAWRGRAPAPHENAHEARRVTERCNHKTASAPPTLALPLSDSSA